MVQGATIEDIRSGDTEPVPEKFYLKSAAGGLSQFGDNPLSKIDFARAEAINNATFAEKKGKYKREYELKRLFLRYIKKYERKWKAMENYPKQIKQKPAWFDLALSMFKENEISSSDKKKINEVFNALWEYRDRLLPERVMSEEESTRQYGIRSPYFEQPEEPSVGFPVSPAETLEDTIVGDTFEPAPQATYTEPSPVYTEPQMGQPMQPETMLGVRKFVPPAEESFLSGYISPIRKTTVDLIPSVKTIVRPPPQGEFNMGVTPVDKAKGGSGGGAFSIGRNMLSGIRGGDSLQGIIQQRGPTLPSQPVQVRPEETITVAPQVEGPVMARKQKTSRISINRKVAPVQGLSKFRNIELPTIPKAKMPVISGKSTDKKHKKSKPNLKNISIGKINTKLKMDKSSVGSMSRDIKSSVNGIVGGVRDLHKGVRGEFRGGESLKVINLKNIKSNKSKGHKDLDLLKKLKSDTNSQISSRAMECKMIPKLRKQCDKVFTKNAITGEVSKFREEFRDIAKTVPTVKGDRAKLTEVSMLGKSIDHGVDGAHVADVRQMYKNSGTTKQMNVGMMEYDYSFVTGRRKNKPVIDYLEEDE